MDIQPTSQQPMSDDQELAKVLAGITAGADSSTPPDISSDLEKEAETPTSDASATPSTTPAPEPTTTPMPDPIATPPVVDPAPMSTPSYTPPMPTSAGDGSLEAIKHDALNELRPLVDKLNLSAEEKFDTYLLLIRSTDDPTLVSPAFEAARAITNESEKAQALLDIVKEIDYLSNPQKPES